eukprot:Lithocolla_globosa_v1_NODE_698_length_3419_cov_7.656064.p2 type:complete len:174 gc:universal NODE_698_length_3419_cov_7.656064:364-885(+)
MKQPLPLTTLLTNGPKDIHGLKRRLVPPTSQRLPGKLTLSGLLQSLPVFLLRQDMKVLSLTAFPRLKKTCERSHKPWNLFGTVYTQVSMVYMTTVPVLSLTFWTVITLLHCDSTTKLAPTRQPLRTSGLPPSMTWWACFTNAMSGSPPTNYCSPWAMTSPFSMLKNTLHLGMN